MDEQERYNAWFREMVDTYCPNLFQRIEEHTFQGEDYLLAIVAHPHDSEKTIHVSTWGREITPDYGTFHTHFDSFEDDDHEEEFRAAIDWVESVLRDEVLVFTHYEGTREVADLSAPADYEPTFFDSDTHIQVTSWSGRLDRRIERDRS